MTARLIERFRVDEPNVYAWGFAPDEPCLVRVVEQRDSADSFARGWFAFVDWTVRPDGNVRPSGWVRTSKLVTCPACAGSGDVPSASGWTDVRCEVCA